MDAYVILGQKRAFACAINWPGWCRSGKDEPLALQALVDYGPRYGRAIEAACLGFKPPQAVSAITVVERLEGNAGTDFGAPGVAPAADAAPVDGADLKRFQSLLESIWRTFDEAARAAQGKTLRTGPRGGGRSLEKLLQHALEAEKAYLTQLGGSYKASIDAHDPLQAFAPLRQAILENLGAGARGELPRVGPRGGQRWTPRFYVRYAAWHLLDHAWELEDRIR